MAAIYLIRHGQASFGKADYDQLSEKGTVQSQLLGKFWQSLPAPDHLFLGDLLRHEQTLDNFLLGYQGNKASRILHSGFNEFNHVELLMRHDSQWKNFSDRVAKINQLPDAHQFFQAEFSLAIKRWVGGEYDSDYIENWSQFKKRCIAALQDVINQALNVKNIASNAKRSNDICIFTSGGTISVLVQHILGLSDKSTLAIIQQLRNTGVTKLLFSKNNLSIDYFNNYSHLTQAGADWVTFR
jgi:broad specificity phosphatase PhoE